MKQPQVLNKEDILVAPTVSLHSTVVQKIRLCGKEQKRLSDRLAILNCVALQSNMNSQYVLGIITIVLLHLVCVQAKGYGHGIQSNCDFVVTQLKENCLVLEEENDKILQQVLMLICRSNFHLKHLQKLLCY